MAKKTLMEKATQNGEIVKSNGDLMNDDEEPNFSDPEGYDDDIVDEGKFLLSFFFSAGTFTPVSRKHGRFIFPHVT